MAKTYVVRFGSGNPTNYTGLTPTLSVFSAQGLTAITSPTFIELPVGSGLYQFTYGPTLSTTFVADGGAALATGDRYVVGVLDPIQAVDEKVGTLADSFGSTSADPSTIIGYLKRTLEFLEGNATFNKTTAVWDVYSRGSSTLLREKTLANSVSSATKT